MHIAEGLSYFCSQNEYADKCHIYSAAEYPISCVMTENKRAAGMHDTLPRKFYLVQMHRISWSINAQDKEQNGILTKIKSHNSVHI